MDRVFIRASPEYDEQRLLRRAWDRIRQDTGSRQNRQTGVAESAGSIFSAKKKK